MDVPISSARETKPDRLGTAWSLDDCRQLVDGVRNGNTAEELADLLGRSQAAVRAQARRLAPPGVHVERGEALEWLAARLAEDDNYDWRPAYESNRRMNRAFARSRAADPEAHGALEAAPTGPGIDGGAPHARLLRPASAEMLERVVRDWQHATGHALNGDRLTAFLNRREVTALANVDPGTRTAIAARLWSEQGRLLVAEWLLEILCPGSVGLVPSHDEGQSLTPEAADVPHASSPGGPSRQDTATEVLPSPEEIEAARTAAGGWTRDQLAAWGVAWPAPKGWKKQLTNRWHAAHAPTEG